MDQFEREARSLLNSVQKELRTIPKMPDVSGKASKKIGEAIVTGPAVAVTLLRRGIRILKGGEPSSKLKQKEKKLKSFLNRVEKMKKNGYGLGSGKITDYKGKEVDPKTKEIFTTKKSPAS